MMRMKTHYLLTSSTLLLAILTVPLIRPTFTDIFSKFIKAKEANGTIHVILAIIVAEK